MRIAAILFGSAIFAVGAAAHGAEPLRHLDGDARTLATRSFAAPGDAVAYFSLDSDGPALDLRSDPGSLILMTESGLLFAASDASARRFDRWRFDPVSGRPLRRDASPDARCATGAEAPCWRPGDPVPYSREVAAALWIVPVWNGYGSADQLGTNFLAKTAIPLVPLNVDPCDAFLSDDTGGCTNIPGRNPYPLYQAGSTLNQVLTDEQQALLGCGPFWGTDCDSDGIDLLNVEASVLMQSIVGFEGNYQSPEYAAPDFTQWYYGSVDANGNAYAQPGTVHFQGAPIALRNEDLEGGGPVVTPEKGQCAGANQLSIPCGMNPPGRLPTQLFPDGGYRGSAGQVFSTEMAALSINMQNLLVVYSTAPDSEADDDRIAQVELNPQDPFSRAPNQCSFLQPQFCSSVRDFLSLGTIATGTTVDGASGAPRRWIWEAGAEYRVVDAFGDLASYAGGSVHVLGVEPSRAPAATTGVPIALFPAPGAALDPGAPFAIPSSDDARTSTHGLAYLTAPEPTGAALAGVAIAALILLAQRSPFIPA